MCDTGFCDDPYDDSRDDYDDSRDDYDDTMSDSHWNDLKEGNR